MNNEKVVLQMISFTLNTAGVICIHQCSRITLESIRRCSKLGGHQIQKCFLQKFSFAAFISSTYLLLNTRSNPDAIVKKEFLWFSEYVYLPTPEIVGYNT